MSIPLRQLFLRHLAQTSSAPMMIEVERGEGCWLYGPGEKKWLDLISGISVSNVGHRAPEVLAAMQEQMNRYLHTMVYGEYVLSPQVRFAERLAGQLGPGLDHVYFVNSGAEAVEGALKVARKFTGRSGIVSFHHSYHGSTTGALSVTGTPWLKEGYGPLLPHVQHIRFNRREDLAAITQDTACVIIEPIQAEAGVVLPETGYLEAVHARCHETGALLIFDEIQTGFGRTGSLFHFMQSGVRPDILLSAKGMGGGMPIGAFITRNEIMQVISHDPPLGHITTFGGHPVCCAAGLATLDKIIREDLCTRAANHESIIRETLVHPAILSLRGKGLLFAAELESMDKTLDVVKKGMERGVIVDWFLNAPNCIRIAPPLVISGDELRKGLETLLECL